LLAIIDIDWRSLTSLLIYWYEPLYLGKKPIFFRSTILPGTSLTSNSLGNLSFAMVKEFQTPAMEFEVSNTENKGKAVISLPLKNILLANSKVSLDTIVFDKLISTWS
jgi:hypothetical protein